MHFTVRITHSGLYPEQISHKLTVRVSAPLTVSDCLRFWQGFWILNVNPGSDAQEKNRKKRHPHFCHFIWLQFPTPTTPTYPNTRNRGTVSNWGGKNVEGTGEGEESWRLTICTGFRTRLNNPLTLLRQLQEDTLFIKCSLLYHKKNDLPRETKLNKNTHLGKT